MQMSYLENLKLDTCQLAKLASCFENLPVELRKLAKLNDSLISKFQVSKFQVFDSVTVTRLGDYVAATINHVLT